MSMPAFSSIATARRTASRLPSSSAAPSSFQGDQSFSGSASQEGLGRLPASVVPRRGNFMEVSGMSQRGRDGPRQQDVAIHVADVGAAAEGHGEVQFLADELEGGG